MNFSTLTTLLLLLLSLSGSGQPPDSLFNDVISFSDASKALKISRFQEDLSASQTDFVYQRLEWEIDPNVRFIKGKITTWFISEVSGLSTVYFDLDGNLKVDSVVHRSGLLQFSHTGQKLVVELPSILPDATSDSLAVYYSGEPRLSGLGSFVKDSHNGIPIIWTLSEPYGAMDWWPCKQSLTDKIDSVDIIVTTPEPYRTASLGLLVSEKVQAGQRIMHWRHRYPVASYLIAIAVTNYADYTEFTDLPGGRQLPIVNFVYPEQLEEIKEKTPRTAEVMTLFNELFGEYPFSREKYGHAQFGWGGGMEHQTMSFMGTFGYELIAHELAHQWFGNYITLASWQDIWLNEGFTSYATGLSYEHLMDGYWWPRWKRVNLDRIVREPDGSVFVTDTTDISRIFSGRLSYSKGAYLLHMLRWEMGDEAFYKAMRSYLADPDMAYGFASHKKAETHFEAAAGKSLRKFFDQWYYGEGYPIYTLWHNLPEPGTPLAIKLFQETSHPSVPFFEMQVPIRIYGYSPADSIDFSLDHQYSGQSFEVEVPFRMAKVAFDPDLWLISKTDRIVATGNIPVTEEFRILPNPFTYSFSILIPYDQQLTKMILFDQTGRKVFEQKGGFPHFSPDIPPGIYIAEITTIRTIYRTKLVKR
jgi:aminopeptidase N